MLSLHPYAVATSSNWRAGASRSSAAHTVPACGFAVQGSQGRHWVYTGDTGPNPLLWQRLNQLQLSHLVIETAFSDDEKVVAHLSQHLCPEDLGTELAQLQAAWTCASRTSNPARSRP